MVKGLPAKPEMQEARVRSLGQEEPLEEGVASHSSILAWESRGQRSLAGCSPRGRRELDPAARTCTHTHTHTCWRDFRPWVSFLPFPTQSFDKQRLLIECS